MISVVIFAGSLATDQPGERLSHVDSARLWVPVARVSTANVTASRSDAATDTGSRGSVGTPPLQGFQPISTSGYAKADWSKPRQYQYQPSWSSPALRRRTRRCSKRSRDLAWPQALVSK